MRRDIDAHIDAHPFLTAAAAFTVGAVATWLAYAAYERVRVRVPKPMSDDLVARNVRARVTQLVARPDAIAVEVDRGEVRLSGEAAPEEREALLASLLDLPGVLRVRNALGTRRNA